MEEKKKATGFTNFANLAMYARIGKIGELKRSSIKNAPMISWAMAYNSGPAESRTVTWINFLAYNEVALWVSENVKVGEQLYITKSSPRSRKFKMPDGTWYHDTQWIVWEIDAREQGTYSDDEGGNF